MPHLKAIKDRALDAAARAAILVAPGAGARPISPEERARRRAWVDAQSRWLARNGRRVILLIGLGAALLYLGAGLLTILDVSHERRHACTSGVVSSESDGP